MCKVIGKWLRALTANCALLLNHLQFTKSGKKHIVAPASKAVSILKPEKKKQTVYGK